MPVEIAGNEPTETFKDVKSTPMPPSVIVKEMPVEREASTDDATGNTFDISGGVLSRDVTKRHHVCQSHFLLFYLIPR